jgi:hypothetical protein
MYRLTIHGRWGDNFAHFAIFPVRDANPVEFEN